MSAGIQDIELALNVGQTVVNVIMENGNEVNDTNPIRTIESQSENRYLTEAEQESMIAELAVAEEVWEEGLKALTAEKRDEKRQEIVQSKQNLSTYHKLYADIVNKKAALENGTFDFGAVCLVDNTVAEAAEALLSSRNWKTSLSPLVTDYRYSVVLPPSKEDDGCSSYDGKCRDYMTNPVLLTSDGMSRSGINSRAIPSVILLYACYLASIFVIISGTNGSLRITPSNCDAAQYAPGQPFPVATRSFYGNSLMKSDTTEWYLQPWNLRPYQGLCPEAMHEALDAQGWVSLILNSNVYHSDDENVRRWYGCIRRDNPMYAEVFQAMDAANLPSVTNFSKSWEEYTDYYKISKAATIIVGCFALMMFPLVLFVNSAEEIDNIFAAKGTVVNVLLCTSALSFIGFAVPAFLTGKMVNILHQSDFNLDTNAWTGFFPTCTVTVEYMDGANCALAAYITFLISLSIIALFQIFILWNLNARRLYLTAAVINHFRADDTVASWEKSTRRAVTAFAQGLFDDRRQYAEQILNARVYLASIDPTYVVKLKYGQYDATALANVSVEEN